MRRDSRSCLLCDLCAIFRFLMISPVALLKRLGIGGRLVPFFKLVCVYFAVGGAAPSAGAVAAKCAPVVCLVLLVLTHGPALKAENWYARRIALGLTLSALGDALLIWPQHFVAGMAAFGLAHLSYISAFRETQHGRPIRLMAAVCYLPTAVYLTCLEPPGLLKFLVPLYSVLLATMAWRALICGTKAAAAGALLFLLSDAILGYSLFGGTVPYKQVLVMSTYYLGQLGIAFSVLTQKPVQASSHPQPVTAD